MSIVFDPALTSTSGLEGTRPANGETTGGESSLCCFSSISIGAGVYVT